MDKSPIRMVQIIILERRNGIDISRAPGKNNWINSSKYVNVLIERAKFLHYSPCFQYFSTLEKLLLSTLLLPGLLTKT